MTSTCIHREEKEKYQAKSLDDLYNEWLSRLEAMYAAGVVSPPNTMGGAPRIKEVGRPWRKISKKSGRK